MTIARGPKMNIAALHGLYFLATGVWPLLSRRSFERVTGPKADFWLAQTVGILVAGVGRESRFIAVARPGLHV